MPGYISNLVNYANRQLVILHKGDTMPVQITSDLAAAGWLGGQFVRWVADPAGSGQPTLDIADGRYCGFFAFGSNEPADQFTSMTGQNTRYRYISLFFGGNMFYTSTYETYGYVARHGGPLVPLTYTPNNPLYVSENGKITSEDESDMVVFGGPIPNHTFPDGSPILSRFVFFGSCVAAPTAAMNNYLGVQTNFGV